jgi:hypothetical protein
MTQTNMNISELTQIPIEEVLDLARQKYQESNYPDALICYEYFFDHSLDNDPSFYGVRLSYCLNEWAMLADLYSPALDALENKRKEVKSLFETTSTSIHFNEYRSISEYLNKKSDSFNLFLDYHTHKPQLAQKAVRYIWNELIEKELWDICIQYNEYLESIYEHSLNIFDNRIKLSNEDAQFQDDWFTEGTVKNFIKEVSDLLLVYQHTNQVEKIKQIKVQATSDMLLREQPEIINQINNQ